MFDYTEKNIKVLQRALSPERLQPYLVKARGDVWIALQLYVRNTELSEALYGVVQGFEVLLRNVTHAALVKAADHEFWWDRLSLREEELSDIAKARQKIDNRLKLPTSGRIVAELTLGFWVNLYASFYEKEMWVRVLHTQFPARLQRQAVHIRLGSLRDLRNRIAHHETLIRRNTQADYQQLMETVGWLSPTTRSWIEDTSCFETRFTKRLPKRLPTDMNEAEASKQPE